MGQKRSASHDFQLGELVQLAAPVAPLRARTIVQVVGFRGDQIRLLPIGGIPVLAPHGSCTHTDLPAGRGFIAGLRRRRRKPKPQIAA